MKIGLVDFYKIMDETKLGYKLENEEGEEIFMHHNESGGNYFKIGETITAFLYFDKMKRVAATVARPFITINRGALCEVVNSSPAGLFINIGISRDILFSSDDLPESLEKWPRVGDKLPCKLRLRGNNLFIKLMNKDEILAMNKVHNLEVGSSTIGYIYRITESGINIVDENYNIVFVYHKNYRREYRYGEKVEVKILNINDVDYSGSLIEQKEVMIKDDSEKILEYLDTHYGVMNYTENTDPLVIEKVFQMSKSAFKRALGKLYKERKVILEEKRVVLTKIDD